MAGGVDKYTRSCRRASDQPKPYVVSLKGNDRHYLARDTTSLTLDELDALLVRSKGEDAEAVDARNEIVVRFLPLIIKISNEMLRNGDETLFEELVSVGYSTLLEITIPKWDFAKATKPDGYRIPFATFAAIEMRRKMVDYSTRRTWSTPVPNNLTWKVVALERSRFCLEGGNFTLEDVAAEFDWSINVARRVMNAWRAHYTKSFEVRFAGRDHLYEHAELRDLPTLCDRNLEMAEVEEELAKAFRVLTAREREIIRERWLSHNPLSQRELAEILDVSNSTISKIENEAFTKMREALCA